MQYGIFSLEKIFDHLCLEVVSCIFLPPKTDAYLLSLPGKSLRHLRSAGIGNCQIAAKIIDNYRLERSNFGYGNLDALPIRNLPRVLQAHGPLGLLQFDSFPKVEELGYQIRNFITGFLALRSNIDDRALNTAIQLFDRPEKRRWFLHTVFHGHPSEEMDLTECETGFFALQIELNPWKLSTTGFS